VTPDAIRASCIVGTPGEVVAQLREMERNGLNEINLLPAADWQRSVWRDFAELVMPSFR
jgi:alkanesulfonate monooxygenase SsuD/methylene tetrahydromethanopterin reductase-like flavin-dependent oxidoreductase (luciferase family)